MQEDFNEVKKTFIEEVNEVLNYSLTFTKEISITIKGLLFIVIALIVTSIVLKIIRNLVTRKLPDRDKLKFNTFFTYIRWFVFVVIFLIAMNTAGVNVTAVFAASAALLIGVGIINAP